MSSFNILHVVSSIGLYGKEQVVLELMRQHQKMGVRSVLGNLRLPGEEDKPIEVVARKEGLEVQPFFLNRGMDFKGAKAILDFAHKESINLIHIHDYKGSILLGFPRWFRKTPKLVRTLHGFTTTTALSKIAVYEWLDRQSLRFHDLTIGVSSDMNQHFPKAPVIKNGISTFRESKTGQETQAIYDFCQKGVVFGAVARMSPEKNLVALVEAVHLLRSQGLDAYLLIIGEGQERPAIEAKIQECQLQDFCYLPGFVNDARQVMRWMDVLVQPSVREGTPITILEAMEARVPLAMTPVGAMEYFLREGAGWTLSTHAKEMSVSLMACWENAQERSRRVDSAYALYEREYSGEVMARNYLSLFEQTFG